MQYLGCKPSKKDLRNYKIKATAAQIQDLPEEYCLKQYGKIKNQGSVGSCVAHSMSSILEYHDKGKNTLSTNFIYGIKRQLFDDTTHGMYLSDACKIASKYGDMLETDCKGNSEVPNCFYAAEDAFKDQDKLNKAYSFHIKSYFSCKTPQDIKVAIHKYGPVAACVKWYNGSKASTDGTFKFNTKRDYCYHCIMLYGWNKDGFICQNSFGKSWGDEGRFILPFDYPINEAKGIVDAETTSDNIVIPKRNKFLDIIYKTINWFLNLFR